MENTDNPNLDRQIADRLKALRRARGWPLDELARRSGLSRATLSRLENAEVSATAAALGKLCAAHGLALSQLMRMVEDEFTPLLPAAVQPLWTDPASGQRRHSVSPPARGLAGEVLRCELPPFCDIRYDAPPRRGLEHHLLMLDGCLEISVGGQSYRLQAGDCLRYRLSGASAFRTGDAPARYLLFIV
ncbi:XRE family transcriptional regulator [Chromobacterium sphagni]|uniref:XRE family transcriptional regulator n=1 Tax=Chromobacterium sphagni TaxID=1903179 RepID=A0A1S1X1V3_9NEIS|nr:XRE family transcriptional regulator [Chromobacterium sphagni]OHX13146.1 XRE family transcriptional regulator [Chromobacterium sphagni]